MIRRAGSPRRTLALVVLAALLAPAVRAQAPGPRALAHDPFDGAAAAPVAPTAPRPGATAPRPWKPQLRGLIEAGEHSVANIDGQVYRLGDLFEDHRVAGFGRESVILRGIRTPHTHELRLPGAPGVSP